MAIRNPPYSPHSSVVLVLSLPRLTLAQNDGYFYRLSYFANISKYLSP